MNQLDTLISVLDDRADAASGLVPDLHAVEGRVRARRIRHRRAGVATSVVMVVTVVVVVLARGPAPVVRTVEGTGAKPIVLTLPLNVERALTDGRTVTVEATAPLPTYGPYGPDHFAHPAATCPADAIVSIVKGELGRGGGAGVYLPVVVDPNDRRAYVTAISRPSAPITGGPADAVVLVPGTDPGRRFRLVDTSGVRDDTVATSRVTILVAVLTVGNPPSRGIAAFEGHVEELDARGAVTRSIAVDYEDPMSIVPHDCWPSNQPVALRADAPPADRTGAEAAAIAALRTIGAGAGPMKDGVPIDPIAVRWESPTTAWVKYRIALFPATSDNPTSSGPVLWADVRFDGTSWSPSPAARCVYLRFWRGSSSCAEAPDTQPVE